MYYKDYTKQIIDSINYVYIQPNYMIVDWYPRGGHLGVVDVRSLEGIRETKSSIVATKNIY